jgi:hypothetical protein
MANATIGHIRCPFTNEENCEVRRDKKMKLYYYGSAGLVKPNLPAGQAYMKKHSVFIGDNAEPLPPVNENNPVNEKKPVTEKETVNEKPKAKSGLMRFLTESD